MKFHPKGLTGDLALCENMQKKLTRQVHQQLISSCVHSQHRKEDEYVYVGEIFKKFGCWLFFWKKRKSLSTKDKLFGGLLK